MVDVSGLAASFRPNNRAGARRDPATEPAVARKLRRFHIPLSCIVEGSLFLVQSTNSSNRGGTLSFRGQRSVPLRRRSECPGNRPIRSRDSVEIPHHHAVTNRELAFQLSMT